jgi:hypothetical protein
MGIASGTPVRFVSFYSLAIASLLHCRFHCYHHEQATEMARVMALD